MAAGTDVQATQDAKHVPPRETKAQRIERLKLAKNPWECFEEIKEFARKGRDSVLPEWTALYFRWWGIYTQGDGAGVVAGNGGEGKSTKYFMLRIRLPNGLLRSNQLRMIANLAERHGRSVADITVRQNIQLHWLTIEDLPEVIESLAAVGLTPKSACGDVPRNLTGCPLAGIASDEICDASQLLLEANDLLAASNDFYNLPRKFKVCITGCRVWCSYPEINDLGLTAIERYRQGKREVGFSVRVGGGLSADPHFAVRLDAFVRWGQAMPVVRGIAEIFRDQQSLRENRDRARLKHLFTRHAWTSQQFLEELTDRLGFTLDPAEEEAPPADVYRDHVGIHPQKQPGLFYAGVAVLRGGREQDLGSCAHDRVHVHARLCEDGEQLRRARALHAVERLVARMRDSGDQRLLEHAFVLLANPGAVRHRERGADVQLDVVVPRDLDRAYLEHPRARGGHLEHLLVADSVQLARLRVLLNQNANTVQIAVGG